MMISPVSWARVRHQGAGRGVGGSRARLPEGVRTLPPESTILFCFFNFRGLGIRDEMRITYYSFVFATTFSTLPSGDRTSFSFFTGEITREFSWEALALTSDKSTSPTKIRIRIRNCDLRDKHKFFHPLLG
jgi:hypothetical protein